MEPSGESLQILVAVKGAGDLATGVIHRLARAGFAVMATELPQPTVLRRTVAFAEAIALGQMTVEDITARYITSIEDIPATLTSGLVPIMIDPDGTVLKQIHPTVLVEATLSKRNTGITMADAAIVIALGPGYEAGKDVHAVIETNRGHNLGRVYLQGYAEPNTGVPGAIGGYTAERLLRAPCAGTLYGLRQIGDTVQAGETVAVIETDQGGDQPGQTGDPAHAEVPTHAPWHAQGVPLLWTERRAIAVSHSSGTPCACHATVAAAISGTLRGLVRDGLVVSAGMKIGDIDPRAVREHCFTISDKSRAVAGGVLEAVMYLLRQL